MAITTTWTNNSTANIFQNFVSSLLNGRQSAFKSDTRKALHRAYATFAPQHPEWELNLFDEDFLTHEGAEALQAFADGQRSQHDTAIALATTWSDTLGPAKPVQRKRRIADATMAADTLLHSLAAELG